MFILTLLNFQESSFTAAFFCWSKDTCLLWSFGVYCLNLVFFLLFVLLTQTHFFSVNFCLSFFMLKTPHNYVWPLFLFSSEALKWGLNIFSTNGLYCWINQWDPSQFGKWECSNNSKAHWWMKRGTEEKKVETMWGIEAMWGSINSRKEDEHNSYSG